ncbi:Pvc16 family protein [Amycolatopsis sp. cg5]|uniref:Pvc16 family protein n=1 Tax=Amycolatopsis sp. cg5 TaxID=3238802 RepID=UPI003525137D
MIEEVDASVAAWLGAGLPAGVAISFDRPRSRPGPSIGLFLFRIRAEQPGGPLRVRDGDGRLSGTRLPVRHYRLSYLVTASAVDGRAEHRLLGAVLMRHAEAPVLPEDCLRGFLREVGTPLSLTLGADVTPLESMRSPVVLSLTVPVTPALTAVTTPAVTGIDLRHAENRGSS